MEKKLTRAEEAALKAYPHYTAENLDDVIKARKFFAKGYEQGKVDMKVEMMNEAVEGEIVKDISNKLAVTAKNVNLEGFKFGDKVKIIVKQDDRPRD